MTLRSFVLPLALASSCATLHPASLPPPPPVNDLPAAQAHVERYSLHHQPGLLSESWQRADGDYTLPMLQPLLGQYEETRAIQSRMGVRSIVIGTIAALGAGLAGFTAGYSLTAPRRAQFSDEAHVALYATSGGLLLTSILTALLWPNPSREIEGTYNDALRRSANLGP